LKKKRKKEKAAGLPAINGLSDEYPGPSSRFMGERAITGDAWHLRTRF
jgi:hypothetical protein